MILGKIYICQQNYNKALENLEQAKTKDEINIEIYRNIAEVYSRQEKYDKAIEILEEAKGKFADEYEVYSDLAEVYKSQKKYEEAIKILEEAKGKFADEYEVYNDLSEVYNRQKKYDKAIKILKEAKEILDKPFNNIIYKNIGFVLTLVELANMYSEHKAEDLYKKALEKYNKILTIDDYDALRGRAEIYLLQNKYKDALDDFKKIKYIRNNIKDDSLYLLDLAHAYLGLSLDKKAKELIEDVISKSFKYNVFSKIFHLYNEKLLQLNFFSEYSKKIIINNFNDNKCYFKYMPFSLYALNSIQEDDFFLRDYNEFNDPADPPFKIDQHRIYFYLRGYKAYSNRSFNRN